MIRTVLLEINPVAATFGIDPTKVFGALAGLLLMAVIALWVKLGQTEKDKAKQAESHKSDHEKLLRENLEALKAMDISFRGIESSLRGVGKDTLREFAGLQIKLSEGHQAIVKQIETLEKSLNNDK